MLVITMMIFTMDEHVYSYIDGSVHIYVCNVVMVVAIDGIDWKVLCAHGMWTIMALIVSQ